MSETEALPRETGSEKTTPCPICGADLPAVSTEYGSTTAGACPNCVEGAQLEAQKAAAAAADERGYPAGAPSEEWKHDELDAYAAAAGVEVDGTKAEKAAALEGVPEPEHPQA